MGKAIYFESEVIFLDPHLLGQTKLNQNDKKPSGSVGLSSADGSDCSIDGSDRSIKLTKNLSRINHNALEHKEKTKTHLSCPSQEMLDIKCNHSQSARDL